MVWGQNKDYKYGIVRVMDNQNDTKTLDDLDLSGIEGYDAPGDNTPVEAIEPIEAEAVAPIEAPADAPVESDGPISWSEIESIVPEPLHEDIRPLVEDWRRQYQRVMEESTPFRRFAEQGYSEKDMDMALQVQRALVQDPRKFYDGLGDTYGWNREAQLAEQISQQQAMLQAQQQMQPQQFGDSNYMDEWGNPVGQQQQAPAESQLSQQLAQTQQRLEQMEQYQQEQTNQLQQEREAAAGRAQLESELNQLEEKYGQFDRKEVIKRAIGNSSQGANPSVAKAFHELRDYEEGVRRKYASNRPPKVMGSGNGMTPAAPADLSSNESRREAALALAIRLGAAN